MRKSLVLSWDIWYVRNTGSCRDARFPVRIDIIRTGKVSLVFKKIAPAVSLPHPVIPGWFPLPGQHLRQKGLRL